MPTETMTGVVPRDHFVHFYDGDDQLIAAVGEFLIEGALAGDLAIILATESHTRVFEAVLSETMADVPAIRRDGSLLILDANEALSRYLVGGSLDAESFIADMSRLIRRLADSGRGVRIYGELVALLWDSGHVAAAIDLEASWNELGRRVPFALFCGYPVRSLHDHGHADSFLRVSSLHSAIVAPVHANDASESTTFTVARAQDARSFPCERSALRGARQFVADSLVSWGNESLVDDALLVVAELMTNAVIHAQSEFVVAIAARGDSVRVSVRDGSAVLPVMQDPDAHSVSGRGLVLVAGIAQRWGIELIGNGKVVWADLSVANHS